MEKGRISSSAAGQYHSRPYLPSYCLLLPHPAYVRDVWSTARGQGKFSQPCRFLSTHSDKSSHPQERPPPTLNYPSVSFELAFENKEDGLEAIRKFDGALADGRLLKLGLLERRGERGPHTAFSQATAAATAARKGPNGELVPGPAPLARAPSSSKLRSDLIVQQVVPSGPSQGNAGRELLGNNGRATAIRQHQSRQQQQQKAAPSLASRLLGPSVAKKAGVAASGLGTGVGVKGAPKGPKSTTTPSLQSRISIPLAQRLAGGPSAAPKSDL